MITCLNLYPNLCSRCPRRRLPRPHRPSVNFDLCFVAPPRTRHGRGQVVAHSSDLDGVASMSPGPRATTPTKSHRLYCSWKKGITVALITRPTSHMHIINHQHHAALTQQEGLLSSILFWLKKKTRLPDPDVKCCAIYANMRTATRGQACHDRTHAPKTGTL